MLPATLQFLIVMIGCAINERLQKILDYKAEEVRVLKQILKEVTGKSRIDFTEDQRKRLAQKGKNLTPKEREEHCEIVRPRTILDWFRQLYAAKYDSSKSPRKKGRPPKPKETRDLVIRLAEENLSWGYTKIRDAVNEGLGIDICRNTVANILHEAGIVPAPERDKKRTWKQFMRSHWDCLYACDFFNVEVLGIFGAVRYSVFFVMELKTRAVEIAGIRVNPDGEWMKQIARNLTDPVDGFLRNARYLIHDADPLFTDAFKAILKSPCSANDDGVKCVQIPPKSPNCNPHAERFVKSIKHECLRHFVFFGERHLRYVISEYVAHYLHERFHQGLGGKLIRPSTANDNSAADGPIRCRSRLGGLLNFYHREAG
jgi:transposase